LESEVRKCCKKKKKMIDTHQKKNIGTNRYKKERTKKRT